MFACGLLGEEQLNPSANPDVMTGRHYTETSGRPQFGEVLRNQHSKAESEIKKFYTSLIIATWKTFQNTIIG